MTRPTSSVAIPILPSLSNHPFRRRTSLLSLWLGLGCAAASAQTLVLDSFNAGATTGTTRAGSSWVGNVTANPTTITVGGAARDDNGWGASGQSINATGMNFISITGQRDAGHAATNVAIQFEDRNLNTQVFTVSSSAFAVGSLTPVQITIGSWNVGFNPAQITSWSLGGGSLGVAAFRMTFDQLSLSASASPGVAVAPTLTADYSAQTRALGGSVSFTVTATGTAPLTYQWFKNGTTAIANNASATTATLTLANLTALDAGAYTCTVTNAAGSIVSSAFSLSVTAPVATVTLAGLTATYTGTGLPARATTVPGGLPVIITYNGSTSPPVNAGTYAVIAAVNDPNYAGRAEGSLVVARAPQSINFSPLPTTIRVGETFNVNATTTSGGSVTLSVVRGNATINGNAVTPRDANPVTLRVVQSGTDNYNAVSTDLSFTTSKQNQGITFASLPATITSTNPLTLSATASSGLPVTFSVVAGPAIVSGSTLTATGSGAIIVRASQAGSDLFNAAPDVDRAASIALPAPPAAPVIFNGPVGRNVPPGAAFTLTVSAGGDAPLSYQWFKDGAALAGATSAALAVARAGATDGGSYRVDVTNPFGTTRSSGATIVITSQPEPPAPRLVNFSTRARAGNDDQVAIAGFVIAGDQPKPVLIRAVGPTLGSFGVTGAVSAPKLDLFRGTTVVATNSGWMNGGSATELAAAAARVGAFALGANTADSAVLATLTPGNYTAVISAADGRPGVGLIEVYDLSESGVGRGVSNLSVRALSGVDADVLIVGVVVQGTAPKRMLIRAVGPGLAQFGVTDALARPQLAIFSDAKELARNAGWSTSADALAITQASAQAGAFAFAAESLDSALIVTLAPGAYTAQVAGTGATSGVALVEVYELP